MTISTSISKQEISLIGFITVNDADMVTSDDNVNTTGTELIAKFQALMIKRNSEISSSGGIDCSGENKMVSD